LKKIIVIAVALCCSATHAQSLFDSLRDPHANELSGYIFVSTGLSDTTLIALARDAKRAGMSLVLNGFVDGTPQGWAETTRRVADINAACCGNRGAHWQVNPLLYQRYKVTATPAFVIARGSSGRPEDYSKVSGEMGVGNALKFIAQQSHISAIRDKAGEVYMKSFSEQ